MQQTGQVIATQGPYATVSVLRASACEGCHKKAEGCSACSLLGAGRRHTARAQNPVGARAGDSVLLETPDRTVLFYAALVFLVPLLCAFLAYALAAPTWGWESAASGLFALGGFAVAMCGVFLFSLYLSRRAPACVIVSVINSVNGDTAGE